VRRHRVGVAQLAERLLGRWDEDRPRRSQRQRFDGDPQRGTRARAPARCRRAIASAFGGDGSVWEEEPADRRSWALDRCPRSIEPRHATERLREVDPRHGRDPLRGSAGRDRSRRDSGTGALCRCSRTATNAVGPKRRVDGAAEGAPRSARGARRSRPDPARPQRAYVFGERLARCTRRLRGARGLRAHPLRPAGARATRGRSASSGWRRKKAARIVVEDAHTGVSAVSRRRSRRRRSAERGGRRSRDVGRKRLARRRATMMASSPRQIVRELEERAAQLDDVDVRRARELREPGVVAGAAAEREERGSGSSQRERRNGSSRWVRGLHCVEPRRRRRAPALHRRCRARESRARAKRRGRCARRPSQRLSTRAPPCRKRHASGDSSGAATPTASSARHAPAPTTRPR